jgi:hypothetical protein
VQGNENSETALGSGKQGTYFLSNLISNAANSKRELSGVSEAPPSMLDDYF